MKRKLIKVIIIVGIIVPFSLIINNFMVFIRIYYKINYDANVQNFESIIEKSELFEHEKYCKYRDFQGEVHNLSRYDSTYHIDREVIDSLKLEIDKDKENFHFYPFYNHNFIYSLEVSNESLVYLTYNNNSIIKAEYADHTEIFTAEWDYYESGPLFWEGNWYLNFTLIPFAPNISSTIPLNNIFLVKMNLLYHYDYNLGGSEALRIEQFLIFNSNLQTLFVYIPLTFRSMA
ncbi:hypothetical protein LCGC14_2133270 [marine sediment metagenome]|uniref:Uncharacterized protein n=1 Tax=marine sediment metagenome TaxID=412755 RepID=A0A0F9E0Q9_9ZZZZ